MLSLARKLTLRVSRGSNVLSSYTQTQLYTDAALVLDASTRVAAAAGSGLIDLHLHGVVDHPDETGWVASTALMTLRASRGSVMLSSYTQAQRSC